MDPELEKVLDTEGVRGAVEILWDRFHKLQSEWEDRIRDPSREPEAFADAIKRIHWPSCVVGITWEWVNSKDHGMTEGMFPLRFAVALEDAIYYDRELRRGAFLALQLAACEDLKRWRTEDGVIVPIFHLAAEGVRKDSPCQ
jgi:hypothetical protein